MAGGIVKKKYKIVCFIVIIVTFSFIVISTSNSIKVRNTKEIITNSYEYITEEDRVRPEIILTEGDIELRLGEEYLEPGYKAIDNIDGDITSNVEVLSNVDVNKVGTYEIDYSVTDSSHNEAVIKRIIRVIPNIKKYSNTVTNNNEVNNKINELTNYLNDYNISVGYINIKSNFIYLYKENKIYYGASLIKTLDAMYVYENGILNTEIKNKVKLAISKSDNNSHIYLMNYIGFDTIDNYAMSIGGNKLKCNNYFCDTTVTEQLTYLSHLYKVIKNNDIGNELKSYFVNDYGNYLSFDYSFSNLHKYGNSNEYFHDVGIFDTDNPYIIVVLTKEKNNGEKYVADIIRHISKEISELNNMI